MTVRRSPRGKWMIDIVYINPQGQETRIRRVSPVQTRRGAEAHERKLRQELEAGTYRKESQPQTPGAAEPNPTPATAPTVTKFVEVFITEHCEVEQHRPASIRSTRTILAKHIVPTVGDVRVDQITAKHFGDIKRAMVRARAQVKPKTVNNALTVLSRLVRF